MKENLSILEIEDVLALNLFRFKELPSPDTIITIDDKNNIISKFEDDFWDFSSHAYRKMVKTKVYFNLDGNEKIVKKIIYQIKLVLYYLINYTQHRKNRSQINIALRANYCLHAIARICLESKCENLCITENFKAKKSFLNYFSKLKYSSQDKYLSILKYVNMVANSYNLEDLKICDSFFLDLNKCKKDINSDTNQTLFIPSKIYSQLIFDSINYMENVFSRIQELNDFIDYFFENFKDFKSKGNHDLKFSNPVIESRIKYLFNNYKVNGVKQFLDYFSGLQCLGTIIVLAFSGMRLSELQNLPLDAFVAEKINGKKYYFLNGYTSKLTNRGLVPTTWVTSEVISNTIQILKLCVKVAGLYHKEQGLNYSQKDNFPLFMSFLSYKKAKPHPKYEVPVSTLAGSISLWLSRFLGEYILTAEDLSELKVVNPLENWEEYPELKIGFPWIFKTHQFRRSLTIYASRSGLVKFPALKKQLQHISFDMTLHYGKNYLYAKNIVFEKDLIQEFINEQNLNQYDRFIEMVFDKNEVKFGGTGAKFELSKNNDHSPTFLTDKKKVLKLIKAGQLSYKETPLGGCTNVNGCDRMSFAYVTACITCAYSIFNDESYEKILFVKGILEKKLATYQDSSIFKKQILNEIEEINILILQRENLIKVKNV